MRGKGRIEGREEDNRGGSSSRRLGVYNDKPWRGREGGSGEKVRGGRKEVDGRAGPSFFFLSSSGADPRSFPEFAGEQRSSVASCSRHFLHGPFDEQTLLIGDVDNAKQMDSCRQETPSHRSGRLFHLPLLGDSLLPVAPQLFNRLHQCVRLPLIPLKLDRPDIRPTPPIGLAAELPCPPEGGRGDGRGSLLLLSAGGGGGGCRGREERGGEEADVEEGDASGEERDRVVLRVEDETDLDKKKKTMAVRNRQADTSGRQNTRNRRPPSSAGKAGTQAEVGRSPSP